MISPSRKHIPCPMDFFQDNHISLNTITDPTPTSMPGYNLLSGRENSEPDMLFTSRSPSLNGESVLTYTIHGHLPTCSSNVSRQREKNPFTESFACAVTEKKIAIHNEHNPFSENFARAIAESNSGLSDHAESQASSSESRQQSNSKDFIKKQSKKRSSQQLSTTELDSSPSKHAKPAKKRGRPRARRFSTQKHAPVSSPDSSCIEHQSSVVHSDDEQKARKRREKNRIASAKCRQKKVNRIAELEEKIKTLEEENYSLLARISELENKAHRSLVYEN
eukprot:gene2164-8024_t